MDETADESRKCGCAILKGDTDMETCFNYTEKNHGFFSSDERRFINKVRKLKEKYPEQVRIIREPEQNDGCIYCELPIAWLKIIPTKIVSEEQKEKSRVRMKQMREDGLLYVINTGKSNQKPLSDTEDE